MGRVCGLHDTQPPVIGETRADGGSCVVVVVQQQQQQKT
jgi:hypothetical protein